MADSERRPCGGEGHPWGRMAFLCRRGACRGWPGLVPGGSVARASSPWLIVACTQAEACATDRGGRARHPPSIKLWRTGKLWRTASGAPAEGRGTPGGSRPSSVGGACRGWPGLVPGGSVARASSPWLIVSCTQAEACATDRGERARHPPSLKLWRTASSVPAEGRGTPGGSQPSSIGGACRGWPGSVPGGSVARASSPWLIVACTQAGSLCHRPGLTTVGGAIDSERRKRDAGSERRENGKTGGRGQQRNGSSTATEQASAFAKAMADKRQRAGA